MRIPPVPAFLAIIAILGLSATAHAQLIFSTSGTPEYTYQYEGVSYPDGENADPGNVNNSDDYYQGQVFTMAGDVFTPTISAAASSISFGGAYYDPSTSNSLGTPTTDNFTLSLYSVSSGVPDQLLDTSTLTATRTVDPNNSSFYLYTASLNEPFALTAGTTYYLGISDATSSYANWFVAVNSDPGFLTEYSYNAGTGSTWVNDSTSQVLFALSAPEPSSWAMLAIGLGLLAFWRMRRRVIVAVKVK